MKTSFVLAFAVFVQAVHCCGQPPTAPPDTAKEKPKPLATTVCPAYPWMNWGNYYSYYAMEDTTCIPTNYDSTDPNLPAGDCECHTNCVQTYLKDGKRVARSDDPGMAGYGHGLSGNAGRKRGKLSYPGSGGFGNHHEIIVARVEDFEIEFQTPGGQTVWAQVFVVKVKLRGTPGPPSNIVARGLEIHEPSRPDDPRGEVSTVQPVRPHCFECTYTLPNGDSVNVDIITHHSTPGH